MALEKDWFRKHSPAEIITQVGTTTLAVISQWDEGELRRVGWLDNPIIDILYSMTSAGVWIARTDTSGQQKVVEASGASTMAFAQIANYAQYVTVSASPPTSTAAAANYRPRRQIVTFTSNAAGNLDADVDLTPAAVAGYYYVARIVMLKDIEGGDTPTLVINDADGTAVGAGTLITAALAANVPTTLLENIWLYTAVDNKKLQIDTTSANLGNAHHYVALVEYWLET